MFFIDCLAASGSSTAMKVLIEKMKSGEISSERSGSIFLTLTNHLSSPIAIPEITV